MAGHSHSANIAVRKGLADAKRAKVFSKMSRYIMVAARNGGADTDTNLRLRYAIEKARAVSMPKDNIERAVKKGTGELAGEQLEELQYEGFGPANVAVMVDVLTDSRLRTLGEVRKVFERGGGNMGAAGCVGYLFERKGLFVIPAAGLDEDAVMAAALDAGADDLKRAGDAFEVTCDPSSYSAVAAGLEKAGIKTSSSEVTTLPKSRVAVTAEEGKKLAKLIEALDDHDDVQNVYTNAEMSDEMFGD